MTRPFLEFDIGELRFVWGEGQPNIEMYELRGCVPVRRLGWVWLGPKDEEVSFEQAAFEEHCKNFLDMASEADIVDETPEPPARREEGPMIAELGVELGEVTMLPDEVVRAGEAVDPKALRYAGKVVILPDDSVWVDRGYRGKLAGIDHQNDEVRVMGQDPFFEHASTRVRWYRVVPREKVRSRKEAG